MKIIYQGVDPKTKPMFGTCRNCKTQVEFTQDEAEYSTDYRQDANYYVICPVCKDYIWRTV